MDRDIEEKAYDILALTRSFARTDEPLKMNSAADEITVKEEKTSDSKPSSRKGLDIL